MINSFLQMFSKFLLLSTTLSLCSWMVYCRLIRKEFSIELTVSNIQDNYLIFLNFFVCSIIIIILLTISFILMLKKKSKEPTSFEKMFVKLALWIEKNNIFTKTYDIVFNFIGQKRLMFVTSYAVVFSEYSDKKNLIMILSFVVLPRIIISLIFIFELYNKQLHYCFFSLSLLILPLLFRFFMFVMKDLPKKVLPEFRELLDFNRPEPMKIPQGTSITPDAPKEVFGIAVRFKPEYAYGDIDHFMFTYYYPMASLNPQMELQFIPLYQKINKTTVLIYTIIQACGWGYIIFYLI